MIERYRQRNGRYPARVPADKIYRNRANLALLQGAWHSSCRPGTGQTEEGRTPGQKTELHGRMRTYRSGAAILIGKAVLRSWPHYGKTERNRLPLHCHVHSCAEFKKNSARALALVDEVALCNGKVGVSSVDIKYYKCKKIGGKTMKKIHFKKLIIFMVCFLLAGCSFNQESNHHGLSENNLIGYELVYTETISPNKDYVEDKDIVYYTVNIHQNSDKKILVAATSNSAFFNGLQYEYQCDETITEADINIKWLTMMGLEKATEDNQFVVSNVIISTNGEIKSERKINFANKVIEIVVDVVNGK